jgi:aspartate-semialdehyde dehydrogenase
MREFSTVAQELKLPSAPAKPIVVLDAEDRPQPRLDRNRGSPCAARAAGVARASSRVSAGGGFVVTVGRVRACPLFDVKFTLCSHNTIIGAAGGAILNAELAVAWKLVGA